MKWREISGLLCNKGIPLKNRAKVYAACIRSAMLYGAETWPLTKRLESTLVKSDRRMMRLMAGVRLQDRMPAAQLHMACGLVELDKEMRKRRLGWYGHVARREPGGPLAEVSALVAPGRRPRGRPKKTWKKLVEEDLRSAGVPEEAALDRVEWRAVINRLTL